MDQRVPSVLHSLEVIKVRRGKVLLLYGVELQSNDIGQVEQVHWVVCLVFCTLLFLCIHTSSNCACADVMCFLNMKSGYVLAVRPSSCSL